MSAVYDSSRLPETVLAHGLVYVRHVGGGSSSEVYLLLDKMKNNMVVLKQPRCSEEVAILREAHIQNIVCSHPNIATLYRTLKLDGSLCLVLEAGVTDLMSCIPPGVGMTESTSLPLFYQVVCAVEHMHMQGYAHRDIKPENLVVAADNSLRLIDFGHASSVDDLSLIDESRGTETYMAPECLNNLSKDVRVADCWSLGVLLFVMLTGKFPWKLACQQVDEEYCAWVGGKFGLSNKSHWLSFSPAVLLLLTNLLRVSPRKRWTAQQTRQHIEKMWSTTNKATKTLCPIGCHLSQKVPQNNMAASLVK
eukprot:Ihof_evm4s57 gene=Ihof_evmTU4s57